MRHTILATFFAMMGSTGWGQITWDFSSASPSGVPANLTVSDLLANGGVLTTSTTSSNTAVGASGGTNAQMTAVAAAGINANTNFFQTTFTPAVGYRFILTNFSFWTRSTSTGPINYSVRISNDGYASGIADGTMSANNSWALKSNSISSVSSTSPITIRIIGWGNTNSGSGNWRIDDVKISASVEQVVATGTPVITSSLSANVTAGAAFTYQITASNNPTSFAATGSAIPPLSINAGTGVISGNAPSTPDTYPILISAINAAGTNSQILSLTVDPVPGAPILSPTNIATSVDYPISETLPVTGSATNFTILSGTLPAGLIFDTTNGTISGTPTTAGTNVLSVRAFNSVGASASARVTLTIAKGSQLLFFDPLPVKALGDAPFAVAATASSGLPVSLTSSKTNVATLSGSNLTVVGLGSTDITATQAGNSNYNAVTVVQKLFVIPANVLYWEFSTDTPSVVPPGWSAGPLLPGNHNGTNALFGTTSASSGYTNSFGVVASGGINAGVAARGGAFSADPTNGSTYFEFSVTPPTNSTNPAVTGLSFASRSTGSGPAAFAIRSSADDFASDLASGALATDLNWSVQNLGSPIWLSNGASTTFRIYGYNGTGSSNSIVWRIDDLTLRLGEMAPTTPILTASPGSLPGFLAFNGIPSASRSYILTGSNLTGDVVVSATANLEISSDGTTYTNQLVLIPTLGAVSNSIQVRVSPSAPLGALTGAAVTNRSTGLTNQVVVSGNVYDATRGKSSNSLVGWDVFSQNSFGGSPLAPAVQASNLVISAGLTRGSGLATSGSAVGGGWGAVGWAPDLATAIASNEFVTFTLMPAHGYKLSLSGISKLNYRRNTNGPASGLLQIRLGTGTYDDVATLNFSSTSSGGASLTPLDLSTNPVLQNIPAGTEVTFRIVNYGAATDTGSWYIYERDNNPNLDFELTGSLVQSLSDTTSFAGWRGTNAASAALLMQYAYGAASPDRVVSRSNLPSGGLSNGNLTLTYYVRREAANANLVTPQLHTNLADSNGWGDLPASSIVTGPTNNIDGVEVIQRTATVPVDGTRKFLRLKISE